MVSECLNQEPILNSKVIRRGFIELESNQIGNLRTEIQYINDSPESKTDIQRTEMTEVIQNIVDVASSRSITKWQPNPINKGKFEIRKSD